jgi:hypothetical protein
MPIGKKTCLFETKLLMDHGLNFTVPWYSGRNALQSTKQSHILLFILIRAILLVHKAG